MLKQSLGNPMHEYSNFGTGKYNQFSNMHHNKTIIHICVRYRIFCVYLSTGNRETLCTIPMSKGINIRDEVLKFYSDFYSSNIMSLVVLGKGKCLFFSVFY